MDKELEKAANNWVTQPVIGTKRESFIAGAKWQSERMYTDEDMIEFSKFCQSDEFELRAVNKSLLEEFKQFKTK